MAKNKDDIKYGEAQAKLSDNEMLRVAYKHGTPLEGGKIAESEPVDIFSSAHNIPRSAHNTDDSSSSPQQQLHRPPPDDSNNAAAGADDGGRGMTIPKNKNPSMANQP
ncbi:uncharacterized protein LOC116202711 [Punica granatum]|uniref:Seed maturation protein n=2 Tax=Punica granatum TaxID=22663 RepID=A0A218XHT7_PUNGR|nr:uncharacterized protein LOC116202711 [Punica granatum]OWM84021.1 hypothetical protein CDL15_Pgr004452 [Punica granatum]PKI75769.1 hypothetical protein CRG98_003812 [Punica granatum]